MSRVSIVKGIASLVVATFVAVPAAAAETVVDQHNLKFSPESVSIAAGDTIRFTDSDHITHNVTITNPNGASDDRGMDRYKQDIVVPFANPGVYQVHCRIHPTMKMTVTVK